MGVKRSSSTADCSNSMPRTSPKRARHASAPQSPSPAVPAIAASDPMMPESAGRMFNPRTLFSPNDSPYFRRSLLERSAMLDSSPAPAWARPPSSHHHDLSFPASPLDPTFHHVLTPTPARPPRMPRFDRQRASVNKTDRKLVNRLNVLSPTELVAVVKDVESRFRQLAAFEAEEIRRAQRLGFGLSHSVPVTAW